jgi:hypothetical protein
MPTQNININFAQGLDTKTDPKQVSIGKFVSMENSIFTTSKRLTKRNGNNLLTSLLASSASATYLTTLNDNLTAIGNNAYAYNTSNESWLSKGVYAPMELSTLSLIKNNINQTQVDSAVAPNGLVCAAYTETNGATTDYKYVVLSSETGQNVISPTLIPVVSGVVAGSPRVFLIENFFVIAFTNNISGSYHLQYIAVSTFNPTVVTTAHDIASGYTPNSLVDWDGVVVGRNLYIAYNTASGGQSIKVSYLPVTSIAAGAGPTVTLTLPGYTATIMSVCADTTSTSGLVYLSWFDGTNGYTAGVSTAPNFTITLLPTEMIASLTVVNLASAAQNGTCTLFYEVQNNYGYDSAIPTNYINLQTITPTGNAVSFHSIFSSGTSTITASSATGLVNGMNVVDATTPANLLPGTTFTHSGTTLTLSQNTQGNSAISPGDLLMGQVVAQGPVTTVVRSVGLASKAFIVNGVIYFLSAYESSAAAGAGYQPTYFLINGSTSTQAAPAVVAKLAYSNGGGYLATGIPSVTVNGNIAQVAYLYKDLIESQAPSAIQSIGVKAPAVYSQTGINLATFTIGTQNIGSVETAESLQLTGGFGWLYDGYLPVEENFFVWPDSIEADTDASAVTPTGTTTTGSNIVTAVSSIAGVGYGAKITGTGIPANQVVTGFTSNTITFGPLVATGNHTAETITVTGNIVDAQQYYYQVIYDWTDNQGNEYRSAPSIPITVTTTGSTSTNRLFIPTLRLTYKIANPVRIRIYRWSTAHQTYYEITSVLTPLMNDTTIDYLTYYDSLSDAEIIGNNILYTTGGVIENVNSPASNLVTLFDTRAWKVDAEDGNLLWFSKQVIEAVPVEWSDLLTYYVAPNAGTAQSTGPVTAFAPMDDKLILFKGKGNVICFINGTGPDNTGSNSQYPTSPYFVTSGVSCNNQASVVLTPDGLMFQSNKGIWLLNRGLAVSYIGQDVEKYNSSVVTSAVNVDGTTQVRFTLDTGEVLVYEYFFRQWDTFKGPSAISACLYQERHTYLNKYGQVFQESPDTSLDGTNPVLMQFATGPIYIAGVSGYQRVIDLILTGSFLSPCQIVVQIAFNFGEFTQQYIITPDNATGVYGSDSIYGQTSPFGGGGPLLQWRIPLEMQQCQSFQISAQEVFDPSVGQIAGAGFTLSNINCEVLLKSGKRPFSAEHTQG